MVDTLANLNTLKTSKLNLGLGRASWIKKKVGFTYVKAGSAKMAFFKHRKTHMLPIGFCFCNQRGNSMFSACLLT